MTDAHTGYCADCDIVVPRPLVICFECLYVRQAAARIKKIDDANEAEMREIERETAASIEKRMLDSIQESESN